MRNNTRFSVPHSLLSQYRTSSFLQPPFWCEFPSTRKDYTCIGLTRAAFKPTSLCSLWLLSDIIVDCVVWPPIVSSPALCWGFLMNRKEFNLRQFPAIVPRHVATKYGSILTPARSCRKQERNHLHWCSRIVYFWRETFQVTGSYKFSDMKMSIRHHVLR